ncbi:enoyl-CoA hydratase [Pseudoclavibacter sp. AY1F1]|uniref:enoyl-CoA hydratase-related protein n=1 Tax=Pseudoclavibacter sp. AY1F1 TaxID=2080583 RepID=UPI000CE7A0CA|nr:enoyl-CoA hydratase-related protein [Pseudoclavibacter sp. AY1F1]PPF44962.1 enoyl-CoA hydratase [Pseudoclavibacter sp. AY1F1]
MVDGKEFKFIRCERVGRVLYVTLSRPEVLNAMNDAMHVELNSAWTNFQTDPELSLAVLTGEGERSFSVGADLKEMASHRPADNGLASTFGSEGRPGSPRLTDRFDITKPIIAKVRGYALGGGLELAMACDILIASDDAVFGLPEVSRGLVAGAGGVFRLPRQIPPRIAAGYLLTGRTFGAPEAFQWGLVNEVVPTLELNGAVERWVRELSRVSPVALRATKQAMWSSLDIALPAAFTESFSEEEARRRSSDAAEGPRAFAEKRTPNWTS